MRSRAPVEKVAFLGSKLDGAIVVLQGSVQVVTQFAVDGRPLAVEESPVRRLQLDGTGIVLQRRLVVAHLIVHLSSGSVVGHTVGLQFDGRWVRSARKSRS